jgi:hypothetical protein
MPSLGIPDYENMDDEDKETWNELYGPDKERVFAPYWNKTGKQRKKYFKKLKRKFVSKLRRNKLTGKGPSKNVSFNLSGNKLVEYKTNEKISCLRKSIKKQNKLKAKGVKI